MSILAFCKVPYLSTLVSPTLRSSYVRLVSTLAIPDGYFEKSISQLSHYWDTATPTAKQLLRAEKFFEAAPPQLLYSATSFRTVNKGTLPEVAFLGRSNVGKSSLLNAVMGKKICRTSEKPGKTRSMNFFAVGGEDGLGSPGRLAVLDMPGYGEGSREEWGPEIMKYLISRRQYVAVVGDFSQSSKVTD